MQKLSSVVLIMMTVVSVLMGCTNMAPAEASDSPDALALLVESQDTDTGSTLYINQRSSLLTGAYFYPYIEKVGDELRLRIKFHYYEKGAWLNVSRYVVEVDGVAYKVTFEADTDRAGYEDVDGGTADIMDILADKDEVAMLQAVATTPAAKITAFGMEQQKERFISVDERLITQEVLAAYEQMIKKRSVE